MVRSVRGSSGGRSTNRSRSGGGRNGARGRAPASKKYPGGTRGGSYTKMYAVTAVGVIGIAAVFGYLFLRPKDGETQSAACAILVDRTGSSINDVTRDSYVQLASHMIDGCRDLKASFSVYYFDNQNAKVQKANAEPFQLWRPPTQRESLGEDRVNQAMEDALGTVDSVFETATADSKGGHGSDIVTALSLASQSLQQQAAVEGIDNKYLVVLTDGYQTGELRITPNSDLRSLLERTDQLGLVPTLGGVSVSFGGVGGGVASNKQQVSADREALVKRYWTDLVSAGGGSLCVYNVEPSYLPGIC